MSDGRMLRAALAYAAMGWRVFPCNPANKRPLREAKVRGEGGCKEATLDPRLIDEWWAAHPNALIGVATGEESGIWCFDVDTKNGIDGHAVLAGFIKKHDFTPFPDTITQQTGEHEFGRGRQYIFRWTEPISNLQGKNNRLPLGLDVRGAGGYFIAPPSRHPNGQIYAWDAIWRPRDKEPSPGPEWLLAILRKPKYDPPPRDPHAPPIGEAYALAALANECAGVAATLSGNRNAALNIAAFKLGTLVGAGALRADDVRAGLLEATATNGQLGEDGLHSISAVIESGMKAGMAKPRDPPPKQEPPRKKPQLKVVSQEKPNPDPEPEPGEEWRAELRLGTKEARRDFKHNNARLLLENHPACIGLFAFDDFASSVVTQRRPAWAVNGYTPGQVTDFDTIGTQMWLENEGVQLSVNDVKRTIEFCATKSHFDPVKTALDALVWDGVARLARWLPDYLGTVETAYTAAVGEIFMVSCVARVYRPGCQVDTMMILEGEQGLRKSTALSTLATIGGKSYFTDHLPKLGSTDARIQIQGKLIIEIAELDAARRAQVSQLNAWLTTRVDRFRPPWGVTSRDFPRRCVFAGSVNPSGNGYWQDPTGARRILPVEVSTINIQALEEDRDQLWAEAVHCYKRGDKWWIEDGVLAAEAREQQADRYDHDDAWGPRIDDAIRHLPQVTVSHLLDQVLALGARDQTRSMQQRVGHHLRQRGWARKKWRDPLKNNHPVWTFFPPRADQ